MNMKRLKVIHQANLGCLKVNPKSINDSFKVGDILEISTPTTSTATSTTTTTNNQNTNQLAAPTQQQQQQSSNKDNLYSNSLSSSYNINNSIGTSSNSVSNSVANVGLGTNLNEEESTPIVFELNQDSFDESVNLNTVRIDSAAGLEPFFIKNYSFVNVRAVEKSEVTLDLVELLFKDQYFNGHDMWRLKMHMQEKCLFIKKNIEFCGMRCTVRELWSRGEMVTCGYVSETTRLVFRSQSAMCTIYIQMSREMWEFDVNGEMYHEKAVNFLAELFNNWRNQTCQHDVTIALFSRVFYDAKSIDDFPPSISPFIKKDNKNRYHEDYYRIVYQNERYDDWVFCLMRLKCLIKEYRDYILGYHERECRQPMPKAYLSCAAEGNFLETLNLASSVFERHFIDRPFDRTGMTSVVITAGCGVFECDRELVKITKDRITFNAISSDLVCLGEQPLHSVPLLKYVDSDVYTIPHWINLSFYKSSEIVRYCNSKFLPCAKLKKLNKKTTNSDKSASSSLDVNAILPNYEQIKSTLPLEDTDNMFCNKQLPAKNSDSLKRAPSRINVEHLTNNLQPLMPINMMTNSSRKNDPSRNNKRNEEDKDPDDSSLEIESDQESTSGTNNSNNNNQNSSAKGKINPFSPSTLKVKMTFDRRRWVHLFPLKANGQPIFDHHFICYKSNEPVNNFVSATNLPAMTDKKSNYDSINPRRDTLNGGSYNVSNSVSALTLNVTTTNSSTNTLILTNNDAQSRRPSLTITGSTRDFIAREQRLQQQPRRINENVAPSSSKSSQTATTSNMEDHDLEPIDQDELVATMVTGVAWKSLIMPACLPLTTDYCPVEKTFSQHFVCASNYSLILDDIREQYNHVSYTKTKITTKEVFPELVGHRLAMGFQMIVNKAPTKSVTALTYQNSIKKSYKLSLGRIYHEIFYISEQQTEMIKVEIYKPKKNPQSKRIKYCYQFQVPDSKKYHVSYCDIYSKYFEDIKWNLIDSYICIQGNGALSPLELPYCWRQRLYLLPLALLPTSLLPDNLKPNKPGSNESQPQYLSAVTVLTQLISVFGPTRCDIYQPKTIDELKLYRESHFMRFMEYLNKLSRNDERRITLSVPPQQPLKLKSPKDLLEPLLQEYSQLKNSYSETSIECTKHRAKIVYTLEFEYRNHMLNSQYGIPFLINKNDIPLNCFVSAEATWWCIHNICGIETESQASQFMQTMIDFGIIEHISKVEQIYIHGFYLYYILTTESREHNLYTKDYCEVGLCQFECGIFNEGVCFNKDLPYVSSELPVLATDYLCPKSLRKFESTEAEITKLVNVDVDPNRKSNRVEWASAVYRSYAHPLCAFELEIYWKMATGQLLAEVINNWTKMSNKFNYHLVAAPTDPFAIPFDTNSGSDPLRGVLYIPLNIKSLLQDEKVLFEKFIEHKYLKNGESTTRKEIIEHQEIQQYLLRKHGSEKVKEKENDDSFIEQEFQEFLERERMIRLKYFQESILQKYGFIRNAAIVKQHFSDEDPTFFIHSSGGMFAMIPNYANYTTRSRHASATNNPAQHQQKQFQQNGSNNTQVSVSPSSSDRLSNKITSATEVNQNGSDYDLVDHATATRHTTMSQSLSNTKTSNSNYEISNYTGEDNLSTNPTVSNSPTTVSLSESVDNTQKLTMHVNFNDDSLVKNDSTISVNNNNSGSSSTSSTLKQSSSKRERSNTKSQIFYEWNRAIINSTTNDESFGNTETKSINAGDSENSINVNENIKNDSDDAVSDHVDSKLSSQDAKQEGDQNDDEYINGIFLNFQEQFDNSSQTITIDDRKIKKKQPFYLDTNIFIGFLWSWNFMMGKRWRSQNTGDEMFQDNALSDFRELCSNKEDRLKNYYNSLKTKVNT